MSYVDILEGFKTMVPLPDLTFCVCGCWGGVFLWAGRLKYKVSFRGLI